MRNNDAIEAAKVESGKWSILDQQLAGREYVAGDSLTIGDTLQAQPFRYYTLVEERPAMPNLDSWYASPARGPPIRPMR